jgi:1-acyl-sn-glycerol-3-phosphate acyltransferase
MPHVRLRAGEARRYPPLGMLGPRLIASWALRTMTAGVRVEGLRNVPEHGGVLLVARHYHHLLDGAVLIRHLARPVHVVVGLDWTANAVQRRVMETACAWAEWPVILRPRTSGGPETARYLRAGLRHAAELLKAGRVVAMFPEGYPLVDPTPAGGTPRDRDAAGMLPFAAGFRTIAALARRSRVVIVPVGFAYARDGARWRIVARFGEALAATATVAEAEAAVRALSAPA